jgi:hypothetical protein
MLAIVPYNPHLKFLGLDGLGWFFIFILLFIFGWPFTRHFYRAIDIRLHWEVTTARIHKCELRSGLPKEYLPTIGRMFYTTPIPLYHCRVIYVFLIDGHLYENWFAIPAKDPTEADSLSSQVLGHSILVKYDPRDPSDAVLVDANLFNRMIIQDDSILNPKAW